MHFSELSPILGWILFFSFVFGCTIGSFLNVVVWRVPRGESLVTPPSHCPNCGHLIRAWENIPVISWLCLRGRCSGCHLPISVRYPLGEMATGLGYLLVAFCAWRQNLPVSVLPGYFCLFGILICVFQIDLKYGIIPDAINLTGVIVSGLLALLLPGSRLGAVGNPAEDWLFAHLLGSCDGLKAALAASPILAAGADWLWGGLVGVCLLGILVVPVWLYGRFRKVAVTLPVGWGDVKYLCLLGAFLGGTASVYVLCWGATMGFVFGILRKLIRRKDVGWSLCFGPFLSIAAFLWMISGGVF